MKKCKIDFCESDQIKARGLCAKHHTWINNQIKKGKYTWEELEKAGVVNQVHGPRGSTVGSEMDAFILGKMNK